MKRVYLILAILVAFATTPSIAQNNIDLGVAIQMPDNQCLNVGETIDTAFSQAGPNHPVGLWAILNYGPDEISQGQVVMFAYPKSTASSQDIGVYILTEQQMVSGDTGIAYAGSFLSVDSINSLLDLNTQSIIPRSQLQEGQTYGFYLWAIGVAGNASTADPNNPFNVDGDSTNNITYVPVKWHCTGTSVHEMIVEGARHIKIFPNPAQKTLNFRYGFIQPTDNAVARVVDMNGRTLLKKNLGSHKFGTEEFSMDVSALPAGNYVLEISTGYIKANGKFTKK